ncbi:MAG: hypothetical protein WC374_08420 [Phycisphaerae bacterium]|jgi:hypothetical protein
MSSVSEAKAIAAPYNFSEIIVGNLDFENIAETVISPEPEFEQVKYLYCDEPLTISKKTMFEYEIIDEEQEDIKNALESLKDSGSISLEDFEKELGL